MSSGNLREFIGYITRKTQEYITNTPQERGGEEQRKEIYGKLYFWNGLFCENTRTNDPIPLPPSILEGGFEAKKQVREKHPHLLFA